MPSKDITFCNKTDNACPKRFKCWRHEAEHAPSDLVWYGDFWSTEGRGCKLFIANKKDLPA